MEREEKGLREKRKGGKRRKRIKRKGVKRNERATRNNQQLEKPK